MTNSIAIVIIAFLMAINLGILIKLFFVDLRRSGGGLVMYLAGVGLSLLGWQIVYLIYYLSPDPGVMRFTFDFKLSFISFSSLFIALLVVRFYRLEQYINKTSIMIMLIIPVFTFIYSLLSPTTDLIRTAFSINSISPIHSVATTRGIWFWVHTCFCYVCILAAFLIAIQCHRKLPRTYRSPSLVLLVGLGFAFIINMLQVVGVNYQDFDIAFAGTSVAIMVVYFSVVRSKGVNFITSARNEIYDYLSEGIFVLNDERYIVYLNKSAKQKVSNLKINAINQLYDNVFEKAVDISVNIEAAPADEDGLDMTFIKDGNEVILNLREKPIKDNSGMPIGTFAVLDDVTKNRAIINKLENIGGIDALTGLPNRRSIEKFLSNIDDPSKLPIAVISGDVNGLKKVNDNLGHKQGDVLIRLVSEIISDVCPPKGRVSRIGGDEFLIVIPNSGEAEVNSIITEIEAKMNKSENYLFKPSVSFGYDMKTKEDTSLSDIVVSADEKMYEEKNIMIRVSKGTALVVE